MMASYINKMGCDNVVIDGEFWAEEYFSGRHFNCKSGGSYKFPFDPSDVLNKWFDSLDLYIRSYEDEGMNSFWLEINPKENSVSVIAGFSEIETGETQIITEKLSENLDLDNLKNKLKENFGDFKQIQVSFNGYGDSGGLEDFDVDGKRYSSDVIPSDLENILYTMLQNFAGWEIDSGSEGFFDIDLKNDQVVLHFHWNESVDRPETLYRGEIDV